LLEDLQGQQKLTGRIGAWMDGAEIANTCIILSVLTRLYLLGVFHWISVFTIATFEMFIIFVGFDKGRGHKHIYIYNV